MLSMQIEDWKTFWADGAQLTYNSYAETGEGLSFDPDVSGYGDLYNAGRMVILTVRDDGNMVGYLLMIVMQHLHSKTIRTAFEEGMYLTPLYRKGTTGVLMIKFMERVLGTLGVTRVYFTNRPQRDLSSLYRRLGCEIVAEQWAKNLELSHG